MFRSLNTRFISAPIRYTCLCLIFLFPLTLLGFIGCGQGPFEQCLGAADCSPGQTCSAGKCAQTPPKPQAEPPSSEPQSESSPEPKVEPSPEPVLPDASGTPEEPIAEVTPEPAAEVKPEPSEGCKQDQDCKGGQICQEGKCIEAPAAACVPNKLLGELLHPHSTLIQEFAFRPDGALFALYSYQLLRIHDGLTGRLVHAQHTGNDAVSRIFWSPDSQHMATVSSTAEILLWSNDFKKVVHRFKGTVAGFSADSKSMLVWDRSAVLSYDLTSGKLVKTQTLLTANQNLFLAGTFTPEGTSFAMLKHPDTLVIWEVATGKERKRITLTGTLKYTPIQPLSADLLAVQLQGTSGPKIAVFSIAQGKEIATLDATVSKVSAPLSGDRVMYMGKSGLEVVDLTSAKPPVSTGIATTAGVSAFAFDPQGKRIVVNSLRSTSGLMTIYDATTYKYATSTTHAGFAAVSVQFHPTEDRLVTTSGDGLTKIWEPTKVAAQSRKVASSVQVFPVGEVHRDYITGLALDAAWKKALSYDSKALTLRDFGTGKTLFTLARQSTKKTTSTHVSFAQNATLAIGLLDGELLQSWDLGTGKSLGTSPTISGQYKSTMIGVHQTTGLAVTKLLTSQYAETLTVWDPKTLMAKHKFVFDGYIWSAILAPTKPWLAVLDRKKTVHIIDITTGTTLHKLTVDFGNGGLRFSPQARYLAVRAGVNVEIYDTATGKKHASLVSTTNTFTFDPTESLIAIATNAGDVEIYDIRTGSLKGTLVSKDSSKKVDAIAFSADGKRLAFHSASTGNVQLWSCTP